MQSIIIPEFVNISQVGLINQYLGAILVYAALGVPFATFLMTDLLPGHPERAGRSVAHGRRIVLAGLPPDHAADGRPSDW